MRVSDFTKIYQGGDITIKSVAPLSSVGNNQLAFCNPGHEPLIKTANAAIIVISPVGLPRGNTYILAEVPKLKFIRMLNILYPNFIEPQIKLGTNVWIHPTAVIGDEGVTDIRDENGKLVRCPHLGGVRIGDDVRIHAISVVARGVLEDTTIGKGTVIGSQVQVGHNVKIGKYCLICPHVTISGNVIIDNFTVVWTGAQIKQYVKIGNNVVIGMNSAVIRDVPDNVVIVGVPGRVLKNNTAKLYSLGL